MGINELSIINSKNELAVANQRSLLDIPCIQYSLVDKSKYEFTYQLDEDVSIRMIETGRIFDNNDFIDSDFDESINEKDGSYYKIAAATGVLTGSLTFFKSFPESLDEIKTFKSVDWDKLIVPIARAAGYKKNDFNGAVKFLKDRFVPLFGDDFNAEIDKGINEMLNTLSSHPSVAGLLFSIISQFSGNKFTIKDNKIHSKLVPDYYAVGRSTPEKIVYGVLYWIFDLSVDVAISKISILEEMKFPKEIVSLLKELFKTPIFKGIPTNYIEAEKLFSKVLKRIFENSSYENEENEFVAFDLDKEIKNYEARMLENIPVVLNEALVRAFYFTKQMLTEVKEKGVVSFNEFERIDIKNLLPYNNRIVSRMSLIASGCFMGVNISGAAIKALVKGKTNGREFSKVFFSEINIAGVGRFIFACIADCAYWKEDIKLNFQRKERRRKSTDNIEREQKIDYTLSKGCFTYLELTSPQYRALYSLENILVKKDIDLTKNVKDKEKKSLWLSLWQKTIIAGMGFESEDFFITDEDAIYEAFLTIKQTDENKRWFYLMTMELSLFDPYFNLGSNYDKEFKKLKLDKYNYIEDQFIRRQTFVNQTEVDEIINTYKKYKGYVSGSTQAKAVATGVAAVAAVVSGGVALAFAPAIATMIAGEAVVGLHGAALTNAALAYVGGGSLAAGGLGMAGGTTIITGGGALLGVAGTGSTSMAVIMSQTSSDFWIRQTSKLLVFSKCILKTNLNDIEAIREISSETEKTIHDVEANIKELESEKCSLDDDVIKKSRECLKYLTRCKTEFDKLSK